MSMTDLSTLKISPETWSLMRQEDRDEVEAGAYLFPDEPELWCPRCELGLRGCYHHSATPVYLNPIVCIIPHLMEKLNADVVREIGEFSSGTTERDEAARTIQSWWEGLLAREREEYGIYYYDDYEPWRYGCVGPYSENYSRCFGPCCN